MTHRECNWLAGVVEEPASHLFRGELVGGFLHDIAWPERSSGHLENAAERLSFPEHWCDRLVYVPVEYMVVRPRGVSRQEEDRSEERGPGAGHADHEWPIPGAAGSEAVQECDVIGSDSVVARPGACVKLGGKWNHLIDGIRNQEAGARTPRYAPPALIGVVIGSPWR